MRLSRFAPLASVVLAGCLASKTDIALLQTDLQTMRAESARGDSARRAQIDQVLAQVIRSNDSIRAISARLARLQSDASSNFYEMNRQILALQELSGQSQRRLQELRGAVEERVQTAAPAPGDSAAPAAPGPGQLFQSSLDQLRRGSVSTARSGFEELLRTYPTYEDAPEALVYVAETYAAERNQAAADSVYGLVVQRYPRSPKAATALYKRAQVLRSAGQNAAARAALERIVRDYPRSDEAALARDQLRTLGR
ncbi:MAG TPA: tetratricopeptide repeat protein [Gemmatimonadaceae bacterium]|jgi:tol-pal system protein YbgF|nr:tetratricopeptide repeat protein [Gemmatimonadaceae bacterium]